MMALIVALPSILAVYSAITPQRGLDATVITQPLIWIERDYCIPFVNAIATVLVDVNTFVIFSAARSFLSPSWQSWAALPSQPSSSSPPPLTSVIGQSSTPSHTCDSSRQVCLSPQRNAGAWQSIGRGQSRSSHASGSVASFGQSAVPSHFCTWHFLSFLSCYFPWQLLKVCCPVALLHLADPVPAARANNLGVSATTRRLRQGFRQLNKSAR